MKRERRKTGSVIGKWKSKNHASPYSPEELSMRYAKGNKKQQAFLNSKKKIV